MNENLKSDVLTVRYNGTTEELRRILEATPWTAAAWADVFAERDAAVGTDKTVTGRKK